MAFWRDFIGWWVCCQCVRECNPELYDARCPDCEHERCKDCHDIGYTPEPEPEPEWDLGFAGQASPPSQPKGTELDDAALQHDRVILSSQKLMASESARVRESLGLGMGPAYVLHPNLAGWWECGECDSPINPELCGWRCPIDGHEYCESSCKLYIGDSERPEPKPESQQANDEILSKRTKISDSTSEKTSLPISLPMSGVSNMKGFASENDSLPQPALENFVAPSEKPRDSFPIAAILEDDPSISGNYRETGSSTWEDPLTGIDWIDPSLIEFVGKGERIPEDSKAYSRANSEGRSLSPHFTNDISNEEETLLASTDEEPARHGEAFGNVNVKTYHSNDSGYASMASKFLSTPHTDRNIPDSSKWDSESVASTHSLATMETMSSVNSAAVGGAAEQLADTLIKDESICCLIVEGYKTLASDRFERNFNRMLKRFALGLRVEAQNDLEKSVVRLVYDYRSYVIRLVRKRLCLAEDEHANAMDNLQSQKTTQLALERFLEQLQGAEKADVEAIGGEMDSESDNDSAISNDDHPSLPNLEKVKHYLLSSNAYAALKQQLSDFVSPSNISTTADGEIHSHISLAESATSDLHSETNLGVQKLKEGVPLEGLAINSRIYNSIQSVGFAAQHIQLEANAGNGILQPPRAELGVTRPSLETSQKMSFSETRSVRIEDSIPQEVDSTNTKTMLPSCPSSDSRECNTVQEGTWLTPGECVKSTRTRFSSLPTVISLQNWWTRLRRKPVAETHSRIEWTCPCGHDLYADFNTKTKETLEKYAVILQATTGTATSSTDRSPMTDSTTLPTTDPTSTFPLQPIINSTSQSESDLSLTSTLQTTTSINAAINSNVSFLELCVNTGPHLKTLGEIDLASITTDGNFFREISQKYLQIRGLRSRFWLLKPAAVSFVRFSLENRYRVGILQKPLSLPPKSEVDAKKWIYDPCPLEGDPPISKDLFLHYLQCPSSTSLFWMLRFPRKLKTSLVTTAGSSTTFAWGIHIDEGPDFASLFMANFVVLLLSGLAAGLWKYFERDFQGAFGFATWIIAVLNSLLVAFLLKWKQE